MQDRAWSGQGVGGAVRGLAQHPDFVPGLPHVMPIGLRQALISYQDYHVLRAGRAALHLAQHPDFVPGLPHVKFIGLRQALLSYQDYHVLRAGRAALHLAQHLSTRLLPVEVRAHLTHLVCDRRT